MSPKFQETVLPVTTWRSVEARENKLETALFYVCFATLLILLGLVYSGEMVPENSLFAYLGCLLDAGLLSSLWASLPAPAVLFVFAPWFAEPSKVNTVRYSVYLLYLLGTLIGALSFGHDSSAMQCAVQ